MYAFFLDIDGTTYKKPAVSDAVINAIARARAAGHKVFINTARAYIGMPEDFYKMELDGFINSLGMEIRVGDELIHSEFMDQEDVEAVAKFAYESQTKLHFEGEVRINVNSENPKGFNPQNFEEFKKMLGSKRLCKFVIENELIPDWQEKFGNKFNFITKEGILKGNSKSGGISVMEKRFGIARENTVAIGDSAPDIDMVTYAGIGIAMGNSRPELKEVAKYITKPFLEDGVAYAIDCLINGELSKLEIKE